jgi:hypothetical protein
MVSPVLVRAVERGRRLLSIAVWYSSSSCFVGISCERYKPVSASKELGNACDLLAALLASGERWRKLDVSRP